MLNIGDNAPDFELPDGDGNPVRLSQLLSRGPVVLYFYPKDGSPACTAQACMVRDHYEPLAAAGVTVVGINADSSARHEKFAAKHQLPFTLLSDPKHTAVKAYGASAIFGFVTKRISYYIKPDGTIADTAAGDFTVKPHEAFIERVLAGHGESNP